MIDLDKLQKIVRIFIGALGVVGIIAVFIVGRNINNDDGYNR